MFHTVWGTSGWSSVTITHDALDLTIQGPPPDMKRHCTGISPGLVHTCSTRTSLYRDPSPTPFPLPPQACSNLAIMKHVHFCKQAICILLECFLVFMTFDSFKLCNTDENTFFSSQMELMNVMDTSVGKLIDRQRWQMNNRKPFRTVTAQGRVVMLAGKVLSFDNDINMRQMRLPKQVKVFSIVVK